MHAAAFARAPRKFVRIRSRTRSMSAHSKGFIMKHRALIGVVAFLSVPSVAYADVSGTMSARTWDRTGHVLSGYVGTVIESHRHLSTTDHLAIGDPNEI